LAHRCKTFFRDDVDKKTNWFEPTESIGSNDGKRELPLLEKFATELFDNIPVSIIRLALRWAFSTGLREESFS
jgi:hypothetical protein